MTSFFEFLRRLNPPCRDISALISQSMDQRLAFRKRMAVRLHLAYCRACRRFRERSLVVRQMLREAADGSTLANSLPAAARDRIRAALHNHEA